MASALSASLNFCARYARWVLLAGLAAGLLLQDVSAYLRPTIPFFIAGLLFTASFRIGPEKALGAISELRNHLWFTAVLQVILPLIIVLFAALIGWQDSWLLALLLVSAAAPISGSPNLVIMLGHDPAPALRQLVIGTALLPLTVVIVFFFVPAFGGVVEVVLAAVRLLLVIGLASALGFWLRHKYFKELSPAAVQQVDGLSSILMAMVVVGLMWALSDAWVTRPWVLFATLIFAFAVNFGFQLLGKVFWTRVTKPPYPVNLSVISGNRNVALYLAALPASVADELYLFIGCYQFPMYLTPLLMPYFYKRNEDTE